MRTYSVIIPAYNSSKTISSCLDSILLQNHKPLEVFVIDDHSLDDTATKVLEFKREFAAKQIKLNYIYLKKNCGPSNARNVGINLSSASYIAFLDADDVWANNKLQIVDEGLSQTNSSFIFHHYSDRSELNISQLKDSYTIKYLPTCKLLLRNPAQTSCVVMKKTAFNYFNESMRYSEDYDLWLRISESSKIVELTGPPLTFLGRPQLSEGGLSGNRVLMRLGEMKAYLNFCKRSWIKRFLFFPILITFSLLKHLRSSLAIRAQAHY